jgi:hypothetical protein
MTPEHDAGSVAMTCGIRYAVERYSGRLPVGRTKMEG